MALRLNWFRDHPVYQSPVRYFAMTPWDELEHSLHGLNRRMREMDSVYNDVFSQFLALNPSGGSGDLGRLSQGIESLIDDAVVTEKDGSRKFRLQYDVRNFRPDDLKVKTVDNRLEVTAKCEEGDDNHRMYREYHRSCALPEGLQVENLKSVYTPDGVLAIEAPLPAIEPPKPKEQQQKVAKKTEPVPIAIEHN
jgi:HSP20 family molecular chaperone IbpA